MADDQLRLGIVGCGAVVETYHLPALRRSSDVAVCAVADRSLERARRIGGLLGAKHVATDHDAFADQVDVAVVAVPNRFHATVASDLLRAGVHVLVEKPMALSTAECDAMIAAAEENGSVLAVGLDFRHVPAVRFVKELLDDGVVGGLRAFDLRHGSVARWPLATPYLFDPAQSGGGVLIDHGVHLLDHLLWWLGDVQPTSYRDNRRGGVESDCELLLTTAEGATGTVELSWTRVLRNSCVLIGERACVEIDVFEPDAHVRVRSRDGTLSVAGKIDQVDPAGSTYLSIFARQLGQFVDAVRGLGDPTVDGREGRRSIELIERCYDVREPLETPWDWPNAYAAGARS